MENSKKKSSFQVLVLITPPALADVAQAMFKRDRLPLQYRFNAQGTASSEIMDMLGLDGLDKRVLLSILPKRIAEVMLEKLKIGLQMHTVNSGIAFTMPINGISNLVLRMFAQNEEENILVSLGKDEIEMTEMKHVLVTVIVNRGFSADVMEAAKSAGAKGGTVVRSRSVGDEKASGFWGSSVQDEKEIIMILAAAENKVAIMQKIGEQYGVHSEAKGIVMAMPVDAVTGI